MNQMNITEPLNFSEYPDSFNMIIGTSNKTLNFFDNPYIQININELTQAWSPKISDKIKLKNC